MRAHHLKKVEGLMPAWIHLQIRWQSLQEFQEVVVRVDVKI
jgi:hypothetical protein